MAEDTERANVPIPKSRSVKLPSGRTLTLSVTHDEPDDESVEEGEGDPE